jgi:hypothetical protein
MGSPRADLDAKGEKTLFPLPSTEPQFLRFANCGLVNMSFVKSNYGLLIT